MLNEFFVFVLLLIIIGWSTQTTVRTTNWEKEWRNTQSECWLICSQQDFYWLLITVTQFQITIFSSVVSFLHPKCSNGHNTEQRQYGLKHECVTKKKKKKKESETNKLPVQMNVIAGLVAMHVVFAAASSMAHNGLHAYFMSLFNFKLITYYANCKAINHNHAAIQ